MIDADAGDRVIIIFGLRRGAGADTLNTAILSRGAYYALDVTDPATPKLLWELTGATSGFEELGESWSDPTFGKMRLAGADHYVAIIGAGYDTNEDLRFGNTQTFPDGSTDTTETTLKANDSGGAASTGTQGQYNAKGRGIYIIEIANTDPNSGALTFNDTPVKLWSYVNDPSLPSGAAAQANNPPTPSLRLVAAIDSTFDGYVNVIYAGDTGGNLWRFNVGDKTSADNWTGTRVFSANPSDTTISGENPETNGRRILYPPSVVLESNYIGVYFGTGDRAHPLNEGVTDRLYAYFDRGFYDHTRDSSVKTEANMVNLTEDDLQKAAMATPPATGCSSFPTDMSIQCVLQRLQSPDYYGWFIKLDQTGGEKVLASPLVLYGKAYFTTFTPNFVSADVDPCLSGNLGVSRLYVVDYLTGEAVLNNDSTNDTENTTNLNKRAGTVNTDKDGNLTPSGEGDILRRSDRSRLLGPGIASKPVVVIKEDGTSSVLVGCGGGLCTEEPPPSQTSSQIYWMME